MAEDVNCRELQTKQMYEGADVKVGRSNYEGKVKDRSLKQRKLQ